MYYIRDSRIQWPWSVIFKHGPPNNYKITVECTEWSVISKVTSLWQEKFGTILESLNIYMYVINDINTLIVIYIYIYRKQFQ